MFSTKEILENVFRLVRLINNGTLHQVEDLPMLELAKWVIFPDLSRGRNPLYPATL